MISGTHSGSATAAFVLISLLIATAFGPSAAEDCTRRCITKNCDSLLIRYGKYCGKGYFGCPGERPCDRLDNCCRHHDDCVGRFGMANVGCHMRLKECLIREQKSGRVGFSKECPYSRAAPTMIRGMDIAIAASRVGNFFGIDSVEGEGKQISKPIFADSPIADSPIADSPIPDPLIPTLIESYPH